MRRFLKSLILPLIVGLALSGATWWTTMPTPRVVIERAVPGHVGGISADGRLLLTNDVETPPERWTARLFDTRDGHEVCAWTISVPGVFPRLLDDGTILAQSGMALQGQEIVVMRFDPATGKEAELFRKDLGPIKQAQVSQDGRWLAVLHNGSGQKVEVWDLRENKLAQAWEVPSAMGVFLAMSADGQFVVVSDWDFTATVAPPVSCCSRLYETATGRLVGTLAYPENEMGLIVVQPRTHFLKLLQRAQVPGAGNAITSFGEIYDADAAKPFADKKLAESITPDGMAWVREQINGDAEVLTSAGDKYVVPRAITGREALYDLVPGTNLLSIRTYSSSFPPNRIDTLWAALRGHLGRGTGKPPPWASVVLFDYRLGRTELVRVSDEPNAQVHVMPSPTGSFVAVCAQSSLNHRVEIWDLPIQQRCWWFIGGMGLLGYVLAAIGMRWIRKR